MVPVDYFEQNHIMPGSHITIPRDESPMRNSAVQLTDTIYPSPNEWPKLIDASYFSEAKSYGVGVDQLYSN